MSNDITIIVGVCLFLMIIGAVTPLINNAFATEYTGENSGPGLYNAMSGTTGYGTLNCSEFYADYAYGYGLTPPISEATARAYGFPQCPTGTTSRLSIWTVITSMFGMLIWSFGAIPLWLDATLFMALRILVILLVARNVWIGGGG